MRPSRIVLNVVLAAIAIFWLVPSIGLAIISLRPESAFEQSGWWTVFTAPAQLTFSNYQTAVLAGFKAGGVLDSLDHVARDHRPGDDPGHGDLEPHRVLARVRTMARADRRLPAHRRDAGAAAADGADPGRQPVQRSSTTRRACNSFGTVIGAIIFHVAFGLPFGIFLMRNFYSGIPHDLLEAGRIDGAGSGRSSGGW